ncbi:MAG: potassium channel family protein [Thermoplasmatota archaeon]
MTAAMDDSTPRKRQVEELLLDMKDDSEFMVDLAYSALLYDSQAIAAEVVALEEEMSEDFDRLQRLSLDAVAAGELSTDHALVLLRVAQAAEVIANSALEIADVVLRDVELHPIVRESIRQSDSTISKVTLHPESRFVDATLAEAEVETEYGQRVLAAKRSGRWHSALDGDFRMAAGDLLVVMGSRESEPLFRRLADPEGEPEEA